MKKKQLMSEEDFFAKMEWEGSTWELFQYGLDPEELQPGEVKDLWLKIYSKFSEIEPLIEELMELEEALNEEDEDE